MQSIPDWLKRLGLFLLLFAAYAALRSFTYFAPLVHDDGLFLYTGQAWAAGELPYRDFCDHKPPGLFLLLSIPCRVLPFSLIAVKTFLMGWMALTALALFILCRRYAGAASSLAVTALFVFFTSQYHTIRTGGLTEAPALMFVILSLLALRPGQLTWKRYLLSGLAMGAAIQFRQTFALTSLIHFALIAQLAFTKRISLLESLKHAAALSAGMIAIEALTSLYFLINGAWWDYFEHSYLFNLVYVAARPESTWSDAFSHHIDFLFKTGPYLAAPLFALAALRWSPYKALFLPLCAGFIGDLIAVSLSGEYYSHYYVQAGVTSHLLLLLALNALTGGIRAAWQRNTSAPNAAAVSAIALLSAAAFGWLLWSGVSQYQRDYSSLWGKQNIEEGEYAFQRGVAAASAELTEPDERILMIGQAPNSVYFLSGRYAGSRYYHYSPLWKEKLAGGVGERLFDHFLDDLNTHNPALLLMDLTVMRRETPLEYIEARAPGAGEWIGERYTPLSDAHGDLISEDEWFWSDWMLSLWIRNDLIERSGERLSGRHE